MRTASRFVEALKKSVRARGLTYAELARRLRLSEASVKRMFSRGTFTLSRIEEVLAAVDLDLYEVARLSRNANGGAGQLTHEQEAGLAKDERLLAAFWLVLNGWTFEEILSTFTITPRDFVWRAGGPAKKAYARRAMAEFLHARFDAPLELIRFEPRELSPQSAALFKGKLERLLAEFNEAAEADSALPGAKRVGIALLVACRPWEFSPVQALKRRRTP
jgi:transcriptional regulator with XRE-family HTH domain